MRLRKPWWAALIAPLIFLLVVGSHALPQTHHQPTLIDFQHYHYGVPPREFVYDATGPHGPVLVANRPMWRTYVDLFAPSPKYVMIQASTLAEPDHYPIALLQNPEVADLRVSVYLKLIDGKLERSAGLLWRAQDKNNYYAVLADAHGNRVHLLVMKQGRPVKIAGSSFAVDVEYERRTPSSTWGWYDLQVETRGNRITVWLQGEKLIEAHDTTFSMPGRVGLITHADSVAMFDDFYVQTGSSYLPRPPRTKPEPPTPPVMHVSRLFTTDAGFQNPLTDFRRGNQVYWKTAVANKMGEPVAAAVILIDILRPDGSLLGTEKRTTGTFGTALFTRKIPSSEPAGTYTLQVKTVTHADFPDASYDPATNALSSIGFKVE